MPTSSSHKNLPRIAITYCTQCRWLLRSAWLQQELLSTFGTAIGEVALIPSTGGIFQVHVTHKPPAPAKGETLEDPEVEAGFDEVLIWDRKAEGGFPEAKILKQRVRDVIEPGRGLGHSDTPSKSKKGSTGEEGIVSATNGADISVSTPAKAPEAKDACEDCR